MTTLTTILLSLVFLIAVGSVTWLYLSTRDDDDDDHTGYGF